MSKPVAIDWDELVTAFPTTDESVLNFLKDGKYHPLREIANGTDRGEGSVRNAIKRLVERGSLERQYAPHPKTGKATPVYRIVLPVGRGGGRDDRGTAGKAHGRVAK